VGVDGVGGANRRAGALAGSVVAGGRRPVPRGRAAGLGGKLGRARPQPCGIRVETQDQLGLARGDLFSEAVAEQQRYSLTAFFSPAPAENLGTREAAIWIR
jgi:hypothetical protein